MNLFIHIILSLANLSFVPIRTVYRKENNFFIDYGVLLSLIF